MRYPNQQDLYSYQLLHMQPVHTHPPSLQLISQYSNEKDGTLGICFWPIEATARQTQLQILYVESPHANATKLHRCGLTIVVKMAEQRATDDLGPYPPVDVNPIRLPDDEKIK